MDLDWIRALDRKAGHQPLWLMPSLLLLAPGPIMLLMNDGEHYRVKGLLPPVLLGVAIMILIIWLQRRLSPRNFRERQWLSGQTLIFNQMIMASAFVAVALFLISNRGALRGHAVVTTWSGPAPLLLISLGVAFGLLTAIRRLKPFDAWHRDLVLGPGKQQQMVQVGLCVASIAMILAFPILVNTILMAFSISIASHVSWLLVKVVSGFRARREFLEL